MILLDLSTIETVIYYMTNKLTVVKKPNWTQQEESILRENYLKPWPEILALLPNREKKSIQFRLTTHLKLKRPRVDKCAPWTENDKNILAENFGKIPCESLEKLLGRNWHAIEEYARKRGYFLSNFKDCFGKTVNTAGKPTLFPLLSEDLQAYYWIGYLMADGYMHDGLGQVVLVSALKDKEHLENFAKFLRSSAKVYKAGKTGHALKGEKQVRVSVADINNCPLIKEKFDWKIKKTYNPPSPQVLAQVLSEKDKFLSYLIGFIDGDGYINKKSSVIKIENHKSWRCFYEFVIAQLNKFDIINNSPTIQLNKKRYGTVVFRQNLSFILKRFIIDKGLIVLKRKWSNVDETKLIKIEDFQLKIAQIKKLFLQGKSRKEIARIVNLGSKQFDSICYYYGISYKKLNIKVPSRMKKEIIQMKDNIIIKIWESITEAAKQTGISNSCISNCLAGRAKTAGGFFWMYKT